MTRLDTATATLAMMGENTSNSQLNMSYVGNKDDMKHYQYIPIESDTQPRRETLPTYEVIRDGNNREWLNKRHLY